MDLYYYYNTWGEIIMNCLDFIVFSIKPIKFLKF